MKVFTHDIEHDALQQLLQVANLPIVFGHVAAMPDVHYGMGATVGSVIATRQAIIPAAVGVDIGCGMNAVRLTLTASDLPESLTAIRAAIETAVPVGLGQHTASKIKEPTHTTQMRTLNTRLNAITDKHAALMKMQRKFNQTWVRQLGTLGGGNHFIELCLDEMQRVWVMLHSGSRGIGNVMGRYFIAAAQQDMRRHQVHLPDKDLAYFSAGSNLFDDYCEAVAWAQDYALLNRSLMMQLILNALTPLLKPFKIEDEAINCHHNYVAIEQHFGEQLFITRKGAISARAGQLGIIPGSMGARSFIVRGKGNTESFCSCSHGAGRRMSRSAARKKFTHLDVALQTQGVECRKDSGVIDEIPGAYKDIDAVMANQTDLVEVVHTLKQIICIKG